MMGAMILNLMIAVIIVDLIVIIHSNCCYITKHKV